MCFFSQNRKLEFEKNAGNKHPRIFGCIEMIRSESYQVGLYPVLYALFAQLYRTSQSVSLAARFQAEDGHWVWGAGCLESIGESGRGGDYCERNQ